MSVLQKVPCEVLTVSQSFTSDRVLVKRTDARYVTLPKFDIFTFLVSFTYHCVSLQHKQGNEFFESQCHYVLGL